MSLPSAPLLVEPPGSALPQLLSRLAGSTTFEGAADALLGTLTAALRPRLASAARLALPGRDPVLRALAYRREAGAWRARRWPQAPEAAAPSLSAWASLGQARGPLLIDVLAGDVAGAETPPRGLGEATLASLLHRDVTHLLVYPLEFPGPGPAGMISIELHHPDKLDVGPFLEGELPTLVAAAAPWLWVRPSAAPRPRPPDPDLPVVGPELRALLDLADEAAALDAPILLLGGSGTGKSSLARWLHQRSRRRDLPFVVARLHEQGPGLEGASLFGWRKGSFTGALRDNPGSLGEAGDGTLFIDEVDKLPLEVQRRLLGLVDDGRYRPVGSTVDRESGARLIFATNADLDALVDKGQFLGDLRFRVDSLPLRLPALRERRGDIGPWAAHFLERAAKGRSPPVTAHLHPAAIDLLQTQPWPGNLRELDRAVQRGLISALRRAPQAAGVEVGPEDLPFAAARGRPEATALRAAAQAWVQAAARGVASPLEDCRIFRAYVLVVAADAHGAAEGLRLLGQGRQVDNDNHQRSVAQARRAVAEFEGALTAASQRGGGADG